MEHMESRNQERQLIERARAGSRPAFDRVSQYHYDRLVFLIASPLGPRLRERCSAEDLAQVALAQAFP